MSSLLLRRPTSLTSLVSFHFLSKVCSFSSKVNDITKEIFVDKRHAASANYYSSKIHLSPLFDNNGPHLDGVYDIELVDNDTWKVSSGLVHAWRELDSEMKSNSATKVFNEQVNDDVALSSSSQGVDTDFDEIDNMRIRGNLFYKLDRESKEFEEYSFDFHRKKFSKGNDGDNKRNEKNETSKKNDSRKESKTKENPSRNSSFEVEKLPLIARNEKVYTLLDDLDRYDGVEKKKRTLTFNQLTAAFHEPFCLDIYISKASVRACVIHRVTSKVVAVAHSISKDMKFDLASTRNADACAAVGQILAQRALADDIHDVVYTPRKGERLEGKLHIVLQNIIDNGVNVKVKLKQRKPKKAGLSSTA